MAAVFTEVRKIGTLRRSWVLLAASVAWAVLLGAAVRRVNGAGSASLATVMPLALVGCVVGGAGLAGQEYVRQHRSTLLATPDRRRWAAARAVVLEATVLGFSTPTGTALALALGCADPRHALGAVAHLLLVSTLAWFAAETTRSTVRGTVLTLAVVWIAPALIRTAAPRLAGWLPTGAAAGLLDGNRISARDLLVMAGWLACLAAGALVSWRRDS
ncbi:hypothetical protein [Propionibacterium australiense]|uniref:ABC-2 family transporter protein n=1 Tax=Propionibacterium australiense TaxID=119981 RepID=A0A383S6U7_9ACTN|nr:hypothetical protein [Propionibacterium australiense]RLP09656.1 hypothetical protein D7U36_07655 [Propionibacterium australiense]RLP12358.1 hypothetical protein D9T14_00435 [Propionibacterium australiense]SYZ33563.1 Hypothetical protein PROPAUS_1482 [Propionibacterium australiense]VEH89567.1 Uncharacterised protein [Propionibacterium australiense]